MRKVFHLAYFTSDNLAVQHLSKAERDAETRDTLPARKISGLIKALSPASPTPPAARQLTGPWPKRRTRGTPAAGVPRPPPRQLAQAARICATLAHLPPAPQLRLPAAHLHVCQYHQWLQRREMLPAVPALAPSPAAPDSPLWLPPWLPLCFLLPRRPQLVLVLVLRLLRLLLAACLER